MSAGRYMHVDALRAIAVMLVVLDHAGLSQVVPGVTGVTVFFTISGFIITTLLLRERAKHTFDLRAFYIRRAFKIVPPFVAIVVIPTAICAPFLHIAVGAFLAQIFFAFNWLYTSGAPAVLPGSRVVWSLAIEEQFYIVFALLWLAFALRAGIRRWALCAAVATVIVPLGLRFAYHVNGAPPTRILYGSDTRLDSIGIGILTAFACSWLARPENRAKAAHRAASSAWCVAVAVVLFSFSLIVRAPLYKDTLRLTAESVGTALLIVFPLVADGQLARVIAALVRLRLVQLIGLSSYSIYLVHGELFSLLTWLIGTQRRIVQVPLFVLAGTSAGILLWLFIERPALEVRNRCLSSRSRHAAEEPSLAAATG